MLIFLDEHYQELFQIICLNETELPIFEDKISELNELLNTGTEYVLLQKAAEKWMKNHDTELSKFKINGVKKLILSAITNFEEARVKIEQIVAQTRSAPPNESDQSALSAPPNESTQSTLQNDSKNKNPLKCRKFKACLIPKRKTETRY